MQEKSSLGLRVSEPSTDSSPVGIVFVSVLYLVRLTVSNVARRDNPQFCSHLHPPATETEGLFLSKASRIGTEAQHE